MSSFKFYVKDISELKEFKFDGDTLKQGECYGDNIYVYERFMPNGRLLGYEVVKGIKCKNPDGNIVFKYPSSEQFGHYGYFIAARWKEDIPKYIQKLAGKGKKSNTVPD